MRASLRALLSDILDYAGLFPPARLDLDEAIRNYAKYQREPEFWMLARFICPAARLGELASYHEELFGSQDRLRLSVIAGGGETREGFIEALRGDLQAIAQYTEHAGGSGTVEAIEFRLPSDGSGEDEVGACLQGVSEVWHRQAAVELPGFCEPPAGGDRQQVWPAVVRGVARCNASAEPDSPRFGVKLRCGGLDAEAFPSIDEVASAIWSAHVDGVPMKFTAGLHHPLRHHDEGVSTDMHGFLNIFGAGVLAASGAIGESQVREIVASKDAGAFEFSDDAMSWGGVRVTCDAITEARRHIVTSFGSCSFDEPREDLRNLGLL